MWPDNRILELLEIDLPIIQAPMAGYSSMEMTLNVSKAGGLGSLACAGVEGEKLREMLVLIAENTANPININFFAHELPKPDKSRDDKWLQVLAPYYEKLDIELPHDLASEMMEPFGEEHCRILEEFKPAVVSFHFGLPPANFVQRLKSGGAIIMSSATTVREAVWLEDNGCDVVIAQGAEAGGHRGMFLNSDPMTQLGTMALVPQIADAIGLPIVAAGGIADGRGMAAAFALGASAVQVGTAFLFAREARLSPVYRQVLLNAENEVSAITNIFSGKPARCVVNTAVRDLGPISDVVADFPKGLKAISILKSTGETLGLSDFSSHYSGQSAALGGPDSAGQLIEDLVYEYEQRCKWLNSGNSRNQEDSQE